MSEMVERVAKAIFEWEYRDPRRPRPEVHPPWAGYVGAARAAIEAMREPTSAMCSDGADMADDSQKAARWVWEAMIDAALGREVNKE